MAIRLFIAFALASLQGAAIAQTARYDIEPHPPFIQGIPFAATVRALGASGDVDESASGTAALEIVDESGRRIGEPIAIEFAPEKKGVVRVEGIVVEPLTEPVADGGTRRTRESWYQPRSVTLRVGAQEAAIEHVLPDWSAVAPPLLAILLAILFRQVVVALLIGVITGVLIVENLDPWATFTATLTEFVVPALADRDRVSIIVFSLLLGGMVGVISRSGGTAGIVDALASRTQTRRSGQIATAGVGTAVFFDDYANCLIVGNTMRPITDRLKISREKLAYIVDSTAAPITSLIPLSTWVGAQVAYVQEGLEGAGIDGSPYALIVHAVPYMFYPLFALLLVYFVGFTGRDAFTMLGAERRAARSGKVLRDGATPLSAGEQDAELRAKEGKPRRAFNALLPVLVVILMTVYGLVRTGLDAGADLSGGPLADAREILSAADSYAALLWASFGGLTVAILLAWIQRILSLDESVSAAVAGMKSMLIAMIILALAWSLGDATGRLHAIDYLHHVSLTLGIEGGWFPLLVFGLAAATSFATGTAWGTMAILVPIMVPLGYGMAGSPAALEHPVLLGTIAACLGGAVFGDHCSPISDTTVLSSMASACDHIDHVRTQLPYAVLAALVAGCAGYLPIAYGEPIWLSLPIGVLVLFLIVRFLFRPVVREQEAPSDAKAEAAPASVD